MPLLPEPGSALGRVAAGESVVHILNLADTDEYRNRVPTRVVLVEQLGARTALWVALRRDTAVLGTMIFYRKEVRAFAGEDVALLECFAAQAVIAMENARLLGELRRRTDDLQESLAYQTATSDVLKVISRSTADLDPVFQTVVETALRLCRADQAVIYRLHDGEYRWAAGSSLAPDYERIEREVRIRPGAGTLIGRVALDGRTVQIADAWTDPLYEAKDDARVGDVHTMLGVPLLRDGMAIGVIGLARRQIEPYSERQVALVSTFADQAVIAIENARLFNEVQARTAELTRSVAELQALQEVLRVVNSSLDLETVLTTIIERAVPLAQADEGMIYEFDVTKQVFVPKATYGMTDDRVAAVRERRIHLGETYLGRSAAERVPIAVDDVQQDASTPEDRSLLQGIHAVLAVPLLREDVVIGGLVIRRRTEGAFVPDTIAQMQTFAAQSVLAIENARLFDEVQARTRDLAIALEQQTATAEALKVISRSAFDIQVVLDTLIESAVRLCNSDRGSIWLRDGEVFRIRAMHGMSPELWELFRNDARRATDAGSLLARLVATKAPDVGVDFTMTPFEVERLSRGSARSILTVPLLRDGEVEGMLSVGHSTSIPFTQRQVDLVQTFADQAVIAIENARLFDQVQARTQELTRSLDDLRRAQDRLVQTEKMASLGQLTAGIAHEIKNPLNFVNNFSDLSGELLDELVGALGPDVQTIDARLRAEIDDLAATLKGNLKKIAEHGKRADGIVKNMLLHSRSGPVESRPVDLNASCEEALNLAYHGARANMSGFNIALETDLDPVAGTVEMFPQDFTRGLLNLIGNGFYAVRKRAEQIANAGFEPTLRLSTKDLGDEVEIRVRDNGTGISEDVRDKIFDPFFTTKPPGEGTGLGLSLTFDIIVKQHGGQMRVESAVNDFTEFVVTLPRSALGSREHRRNQA